jgi:CO/xanthine dehydrogenase Mo-binding subunit
VCDLLEAFDVTAPSVSYHLKIHREADAVPFWLTGGSRSASMTGGVTLHGARQLKAKVLDVAALLIEASAQDLEIARRPGHSSCTACCRRPATFPGSRSSLETVPLDAPVNFRGVGEGGMIVAPPTVVNAIEDALAPFGVRIYEQHLPPARILELIAKQGDDDAAAS